MASVALPLLPTYKSPAVVQPDPAPFTVTAPVEPGSAATKPQPLFTLPPLRMFRVPLPAEPTYRSELLVQVEPAPPTVAGRVEVESAPIEATPPLLSVPTLRTVSVPLPPLPT